MDRDAIYRELEGEFLATFMGELLPGILHNFANPLNGIMGRAKLLERRLEEGLKKVEARFPGFSQELGSEKIVKDVKIISAESDRFFKLFGDLADKMMTLSRTEPERVSLSVLIAAEMRFADFYLDFKHELKKTISLDYDLPEIQGRAADISLALTNILISAKERMKNSAVKEFTVSTACDAGGISVMIRDSGAAISADCRRIMEAGAADCHLDMLPGQERAVAASLLLFKTGGFSVKMICAEGANQISLGFPLTGG